MECLFFNLYNSFYVNDDHTIEDIINSKHHYECLQSLINKPEEPYEPVVIKEEKEETTLMEFLWSLFPALTFGLD
jgi:hypothetical protein